MADATIVIAETNASVVVTSDTSATISVTETTAEITASNVGVQGATGSSGVIAVTSPITNSGSSTSATLGFDQAAQDTTNDSRYARLGSANAFTVGGHTITNTVAGTIPLRINGASGQTANLFEAVRNDAASVFRIRSGGNFGVGGLITGVAAAINNDFTSAATPVFVVRGAASQSANLQEWQKSDGTITTFVNASGSFRIGTNIVNTAMALNLDYAGITTGLGLVIRGAVSQTANLQEWQNSGGTVLTSVNSTGGLSLTQTGNAITTVAQGRANLGGAVYGSGFFGTVNVTGESSGYGIDVRGNAATPSFGARIRSGNSANVSLIVQAESSQTANLQQWQNSSATIFTAITAAGTINFASGNTSATATAGAITAPALVTGFITMQVAGTTVKVPYYSN